MTLPVPVFCFAIYRHGERMERLFLARLAQVVARDRRAVRHDPGHPRGEGVQPGGREKRALSAAQRRRGRRVQPHPRRVDRLLAAADVRRAAHDRSWSGSRRCRGCSAPTPALGPPLSTGTFVSFLLYTTMFVQPIEIVGQMARTMNRATTSAHRVFEVLDTEPEVQDAPSRCALSPSAGTVEFENVTFAYDGVRQVLRGVSFEVAPGELIGLVGPSGGGKTTLVNLIARFYDVTGGQVRDRRRRRARARQRRLPQPGRHGAPGSVPVSRHRAGEHPLRHARGVARGGDRRPRARPTRTTSSASCRTGTTPWSASAATRSRAASASASRSRARSCTTRAS